MPPNSQHAELVSMLETIANNSKIEGRCNITLLQDIARNLRLNQEELKALKAKLEEVDAMKNKNKSLSELAAEILAGFVKK